MPDDTVIDDPMGSRVGLERLTAHLQDRYGIRVAELTELDLGVFRVDRHDGPTWVARVFPAARALSEVEGDAKILNVLQKAGFPAERCAHPEAVSTHEGQGVLVTEFVPGVGPDGRGRTFAILGALLGALHTHAGAASRNGGAWHHLCASGGPREEIDAALALLDQARSAVPVEQLHVFDALQDELESADDCADLPQAFVHPDFVPANAIESPDGSLVMVDWAGSGRGPRVWSLGLLLWAAGARDLRLVDAVVSRYRKRIRLEPQELARLDAAIRARPLTLDCWSLCMGRKAPAAVMRDVARNADLAQTIAARARQAFEA